MKHFKNSRIMGFTNVNGVIQKCILFPFLFRDIIFKESSGRSMSLVVRPGNVQSNFDT